MSKQLPEIAVLGNTMADVRLKPGQKMDTVFNCNGQFTKKVRQNAKLVFLPFSRIYKGTLFDVAQKTRDGRQRGAHD